MTEYIEREAAVKIVEKYGTTNGSVLGKHSGVSDCVAVEIEKLPAEDVVPVIHGRWVGLEYDGYADGAPVYDLWECSECGEEVRGEDVPETHLYCLNCGAKMDGGVYDAID